MTGCICKLAFLLSKRLSLQISALIERTGVIFLAARCDGGEFDRNERAIGRRALDFDLLVIMKSPFKNDHTMSQVNFAMCKVFRPVAFDFAAFLALSRPSPRVLFAAPQRVPSTRVCTATGRCGWHQRVLSCLNALFLLLGT